MKKAAGHISVILRGILFIGFSIQIVLGIIWMCFNFAHLQEFSETRGILYRGFRSLTGERFWILYLLQLGLGGYAAHRFLNKIYPMDFPKSIWGSLVLLTFPMAMQCHLAVSPYSFVSSLFLLELSAAAAVVRERDGNTVTEFAVGGLCWLLLALLLPEYFILGAVPLLLAFLFGFPGFRGQLRKMGLTALLLAAYGGMIMGIGALAGETNQLPDRETIAFSLFDRMTWPTLWVDHDGWPEEVRAAVDDYVWSVSQYAGDMQRVIRPLLQESLDDEQAVKYYLEMAATSWRMHAPMIIRQVGGDFLGYSVTPLILPMQLKGEAYASYSGRNYEIMFLQSPVLTKYYVNYSCWWFAAMLILALAFLLIRTAEHSVRHQRRDLAAVLLCFSGAAAVAAAYTMRGAGMMDYKCTVAVNLLWLAAVLQIMRKSDASGNGVDGNIEEAERKNI